MAFLFSTVPPPPMRPPSVPDSATTSTSAIITWSPPPGNIVVTSYVVLLRAVSFRMQRFGGSPAKRQTETISQLQTCLSSHNVPANLTLSVNSGSSLNVTDLCELVEH